MGAFEILPSSGGVFEIAVDGRQVFSKREAGRFPEEGEAERLIGAALDGATVPR